MRLTGSITALATPFAANGDIDERAWQRLVQQQLDGGSHALVVAGSTGEAAALSDAEFSGLVRRTVEQVDGRIPVLAGTGASATSKTIAITRAAAQAGADAALVVTPPYVRPTQAGLIAHYRAVADDGTLPVVLYNVPGRTGCDMQPETVAELVTHPRIIAVKEARNDAERMAALLPLRSDGFTVLSGDDPTFVRALLAGADGVISVASNVVPRAFATLFALAHDGDTDAAQQLDARLAPLYEFLAVEPNPIPLKALMQLFELGQHPRLPLTPLSQAHQASAQAMRELVQALEADCHASSA